MICICTIEGEIIKVNPAGSKILGYTADEILKLGWAKLVHPDDVEKTNKQVEEQLKGSLVINFVNRFRCKDGAYKILEWQATPPTDNIVYATARDITERMQAEKKLKSQANELKSRTESLEKTNKAFVGRELRMAELKKEIEELKKRHKT